MLSMRVTSSIKCLASLVFKINSMTLPSCRNSSIKLYNTEKGGTVFDFDDAEDEESIEAREAAIEKMRNKSELFPQDRNRQHGKVPYDKPQMEFHESLHYRRRQYGRYGESSKVNPSILWPSKKELLAMKEYEEVAQPFTLKELVDKNNAKKALERKAIVEEEKRILEKVSKVKFEILEFHKRVAAEKEKALKIMEHKNKMIEQVRKEFGYKVDPRDEKFKEMLDKLQKEERKKVKAEKKSLIDQRRLAESENKAKKDKDKSVVEDKAEKDKEKSVVEDKTE